MTIESLKNTGVKTIVLPPWFAYAMGYLLDRLYRSIHFLWSMFGKEFDIPQTIVDIYALNMAWRNLCLSSKRAHEVLGYGTPAADYFTKEETIEQQRIWAKAYYSEIRGRSRKSLKNA
mmetsp:Transcript_24309/g.52889  ORF Transcript_24309/g.52889 Transcript_24309/m.52889 type:complete len:118 (-) Transcript_24309:199-552(-)